MKVLILSLFLGFGLISCAHKSCCKHDHNCKDGTCKMEGKEGCDKNKKDSAEKPSEATPAK